MGRHSTSKIIWAAVGLILLAAAYSHFRAVSPVSLGISLRQLDMPIGHWDLRAAIVSVLLMIANTFVPFPGESVAVVNGAIFGFWGGFAISWVGVMSSAVLGFGIGRALRRRTLLRGRAQSLLARGDALVERGWEAALVVRFVPFLPFTIFNVALGRASVGWGTFLWTTALGVLPMTAVLAAVGCGVTTSRGMLWWGVPALVALILVSLALRPRICRHGGALAREVT